MSITAGPADAVGLLDRVIDMLGELNAAPLWSLSNPATLELVKASTVADSMLASVKLRAIAEVETRGTALSDGASSTAGWLRGHCRVRPGTARRLVTLAKALAGRYPGVGEDLAKGAVSADHAQVISHYLDQVPDHVEDATIAEAETHLLTQAGLLDPVDVAKLGRAVVYALDPDGEKAMAAQEARLHDGRELHLTRHDHGGWTLRGKLDPETGQELAVLIDVLAAPQPKVATGPDPRTAAQRRADALAQLIALAHANPKLPTTGGERPTVVVLVPLATLMSRPGAGVATYADGTALPVETVRRLACDGVIMPIVLGTNAQPIDLGRKAYSPTAAQRLAVLIRDQHTCRTPYCGNHPRHVHHIWHWIDGGPTDIDNLVALCGHCHRLLHAGRSPWTITGVKGGHPIFTRSGPDP